MNSKHTSLLNEAKSMLDMQNTPAVKEKTEELIALFKDNPRKIASQLILM